MRPCLIQDEGKAIVPTRGVSSSNASFQCVLDPKMQRKIVIN